MGSNTSGRVLDAIRQIVQALRESSREAERRVGLSGAQLFVLHAVEQSPGISMNELAACTRTHQSSVSAVVSRLAGEGMVERTAAKGDARRAEIRLSPSGRARLHHAPRAAQERLVSAVDALAPADRAWLAATLQLLVRRMAVPRRRPAMFFEESSPRKRKRRRSHA